MLRPYNVQSQFGRILVVGQPGANPQRRSCMGNPLFATKSLDTLMKEASDTGEHSLKRSLGPVNLVALGIGAIIGAGLFVRTADAIAQRSGPSVTLAFILAGF